MLGAGQVGGWYIILFVKEYLKPSLFVLLVMMAIQLIKVLWLDSREPEQSNNESVK